MFSVFLWSFGVSYGFYWYDWRLSRSGKKPEETITVGIESYADFVVRVEPGLKQASSRHAHGLQPLSAGHVVGRTRRAMDRRLLADATS